MTNPRIESEINDYLRSKEIVSEQRALMSMNVEGVEAVMAREGLTNYNFTHSSGLIVKITRKIKEKKKLDKGGLAIELDVEKKELNTAGMVRLAEDRLLKEQHIIDHTHSEHKAEVKVKAKMPKQKD